MAIPVFLLEGERAVGEFNPNITQRVLAKAKAEGSIVKKSFIEAHKEGFIMVYSYIIGAAISAQVAWPSLEDYLPHNIYKYGLGVLTGILFVNKIIRSKPRTDD